MVDLGGVLDRARRIIDLAIADAELDGFIAAYVLERYGSEKRADDLKAGLTRLTNDFSGTRTDVARLGIALERSWLPSTSSAIQDFTSGFDRLARQAPDVAIDFRSAPKLLMGTALGTANPALRAQRTDLAQAAVRLVDELRRRTEMVRDRALMTFVLAELDPTLRDERADELAIHLLGPDILAPADAAAALWALERHCGGGPTAAATRREGLAELRVRLIPVAMRSAPGDVIDALFTDGVVSQILRNAAAGGPSQAALDIVVRTFDEFPELARRIRNRRSGKAPLLIEDEYDVQDLLYVALRPHLADLTDEEWTPKSAGSAKRMDLVSVTARICIEAKKVRDQRHARAIADELRQDIESYWVHPACDVLAVFVYDPDGEVVAAADFEKDLSGPRVIKGRAVEVLVRVRPR